MNKNTILDITSKEEFKKWLQKNYNKQKECYILLKRGKPKQDNNFYYLDAVEVALCFGWIDSTLAKIDGKSFQRFSPRLNNTSWTELNIERVRRLEKLGLMTDAGRAVLPDNINAKFFIPEDIKLKVIAENALDYFNKFPDLYKRIRINNLLFYKNKLPNEYVRALDNFIQKTKENKMYGQWNDYGRLLKY